MKQTIKMLVAFTLAVLLILLPAIASAYIEENSDHVCCSEECPICIRIEAASVILKGMASIIAACAVFPVIRELKKCAHILKHSEAAASVPYLFKVNFNN